MRSELPCFYLADWNISFEAQWWNIAVGIYYLDTVHGTRAKNGIQISGSETKDSKCEKEQREL